MQLQLMRLFGPSRPLLPASAAHSWLACPAVNFVSTNLKDSQHFAKAGSYHLSSSTQQCDSMVSGRPRVVIITGPTAVGKTKLGLELAKRIGGEIISADSVQVYQGLDVGSDKLPLEQREGIPHHLIDILPSHAEFSAGDFYKLGRQAAEDIISRGKVPIVVGGTGFYLRWFIYGRPATPASNPQAAAKALDLISQAWQKAAAEVAASQQELLQAQAATGAGNPLALPSAAAAATQVDGTHAGSDTQEQQPAHQQQPFQQQEQNHGYGEENLRQQSDAEGVAAQGVTECLKALPKTFAAAAASSKAGLQQGSVPPGLLETAAAWAAGLTEDQQWDAAVDIVEQLGDPETAARIRVERNNWYRLQRVLQILVQNGGKPLSEFDIDTTKELDYDFRCFFLHRPRLELYDRIAFRVEEMVAGGLMPEALMLLDAGMQPNSNIATRAIGYRQACGFLQAALAKGSATKQELRQLIYDIASASRNLVKNQTTWFRDEEMFRWLEVGSCSTEDVLQELLTQLDKPQHEGGCGDSGRLNKDTKAALKRYTPTLKLFNDEGRVSEALDWVAAVAAERQLRQGVPAVAASGATSGQ